MQIHQPLPSQLLIWASGRGSYRMISEHVEVSCSSAAWKAAGFQRVDLINQGISAPVTIPSQHTSPTSFLQFHHFILFIGDLRGSTTHLTPVTPVFQLLWPRYVSMTVEGRRPLTVLLWRRSVLETDFSCFVLTTLLYWSERAYFPNSDPNLTYICPFRQQYNKKKWDPPPHTHTL